MKDKTTAGILALFLGGIGVHKFYLGRGGQGVIYLLFCWTLIPALIALIDCINLFTMNDNTFNKLYNNNVVNNNFNNTAQENYNKYIRYTKEINLKEIEHGSWQDTSYNKILQELIADYRFIITLPKNDLHTSPKVKDFKLKEDTLNRINISLGTPKINYMDYLRTFLDKD